MPGDDTLSGGGGSDGFFSIIGGAFEKFLDPFASKILPIWTAQQLGLQQGDTLDRNTFAGDSGDFGDFSTLPSEPNVININVPEALGGGEIELNKLLLVGAAVALGFVFLFNR